MDLGETWVASLLGQLPGTSEKARNSWGSTVSMSLISFLPECPSAGVGDWPGLHHVKCSTCPGQPPALAGLLGESEASTLRLAHAHQLGGSLRPVY